MNLNLIAYKLYYKYKNILLIIQLPILYISYYILFIFYMFFNPKKYNIVVGVTEIASNIYHFGKVFENSYTLNFSKNKYYNHKYNHSSYNLILNIFISPFLLANLSFKSQNFLYIWSTGFLVDRKFDFKFLKKRNKNIIGFYCGDDIRSIKLTKEFYKNIGWDSYVNYYGEINPFLITDFYDNIKKNIAEVSDKYMNLIFNSHFDQRSYLKSKIQPFIYTFDSKDYKYNNDKFKSIEKIKVVHAPSSPIGKGTPLVRAAIKKLELEGYDFDYEEIIGKPNEYVKEALANSHIVMMAFNGFIFGLFGIEGMATKNCVLMSADPKFNTFDIPADAKDCWVVTGYWEVYDKLKWLLDNPELIEGYAERGRAFVERHYTIEKTREKFYKVFRENGIEI